MPRRVASRLLADVSALWVLSEAPAVLAADVALCHPPLRPDEIRAVARPIPFTSDFRLTVVAHDRPGLLADTTAVLARAELPIVAASATTWPGGLALHAVTVRAGHVLDARRWRTLGDELRSMTGASRDELPFRGSGRATVTRTGAGTTSSIVRVTATDEPGLLAAITRWFADAGVSIHAADVATEGTTARDVFLVDGDCDTASLARHLSRAAPASCGSTVAAFLRDVVTSRGVRMWA